MYGVGPCKGDALMHEPLLGPTLACTDAGRGQMPENLAEIFKSDACRSALYVGANKRRQYFLDWFENTGYDRMVALEDFGESADCPGADADGWAPALEIAHGDIRDPGSMPCRLDAPLSRHGPEEKRRRGSAR